jgi:Tfp pilus assembly protein PilO
MRFFLAIILLVGAIGIVIFFIAPRMTGISELRAEEKQYSLALDNARRLDETRQDLLDRFNSFEEDDLDNLKKMLPANIDNVKLIIELDALAGQYGLPLQNISVEENDTDVQIIEQGSGDYGKVQLKFSVRGPYTQFVDFLESLERGLRIIDVRQLTFQTTEVSDIYQYNLVIETYWLR